MHWAWLSVALGLGLAVSVHLRRRWLAREAAAIEAAIQSRGFTYRFEGQDEALRQRTRERRQTAESIKREGRHLDTRDDRASKIHLVGK